MAMYRRYQRRARYGNKYFTKRSSVRPQKAMGRYIRNVVAASTQPMVTYPRTDPPTFKLDRPFKRRVRVVPAATATSITVADIFRVEAQYYGLTAPRWAAVKIMCLTMYGVTPQQASVTGKPAVLNVQIPGSGQVGTTTYSDRGDGNHRACIKVVQPPTTGLYNNTATDAVLNFVAGDLELCDFYVEFS